MTGWQWSNPDTAARGHGGTMHYLDADGRALSLDPEPGANTLDYPEVCPTCAEALKAGVMVEPPDTMPERG